MTMAAVPVIDISAYRGGDSAARRALAAEIDRTCREIGFMVISGHGVAGALPLTYVPRPMLRSSTPSAARSVSALLRVLALT